MSGEAVLGGALVRFTTSMLLTAEVQLLEELPLAFVGRARTLRLVTSLNHRQQ